MFTVSVEGSVIATISRDYNYTPPPGAWSSGPGVTEHLQFTAPSDGSIILSFADATPTGEASAIIDNISISAVPIPTAALAAGIRPRGVDCYQKEVEEVNRISESSRGGARRWLRLSLFLAFQ